MTSSRDSSRSPSPAASRRRAIARALGRAIHTAVIPARTQPAPAPASADPIGTIGDPATTADSLPPGTFPSWAPHRRLNFVYGGPGGLSTVDRGEIRRVARAVASCTAQGHPSSSYERAIIAAATGRFQIPSEIRTDRFGVRSSVEVSYVSLMHSYLSGTAPPSAPLPVPWAADLVPLRRTAGEPDAPATLRSIMWYSLSMRLGSVVLACDYEVLRTDRSARTEVAPAPSAHLGEILRLPACDLPPLPSVVIDTPLPVNIPVPEPLFLQFFPTFLADLPSDVRPSHSSRFHAALGREILWMVAVALGADFYWTRRTVWVEDSVLALLHGAVRDGLPPIGYTADADTGLFHFSTIFDRLMALRHVDPRALYVRSDQATHERTFFAYEDRTDGYYRASDREGHFGGRPARTRHGTKGMAVTIFGRPSPPDRTVPSSRLTERGVTDLEREVVPPVHPALRSVFPRSPRSYDPGPPTPFHHESSPPIVQSAVLPLSPPVVVRPVPQLADLSAELPVQLLVELWPRLQAILPPADSTPNVPITRLLGSVMGQVDQAVSLLVERNTLQTQLVALQSQLAVAQADAERWRTEFLLLSAQCRPDALGKRTRRDDGPDSEGTPAP